MSLEIIAGYIQLTIKFNYKSRRLCGTVAVQFRGNEDSCGSCFTTTTCLS